jgi:hypothetical protein
MTDFFGGLTGGNIRFTDARIDGDGPLPTSLSGPEGINGDPDGRYNFNNSLLSGITPYAYGQGRMGSDRNYQQIPNRKQFPVPPLWLPEPHWNTDTTLEVSHSVDMSDIAFIINVQYKEFLLTRGPYKHQPQNQDHTLPQWNVFCNICTVNYLLAGLYNYAVHCAISEEKEPKMDRAWGRLFLCFKINGHLKYIVEQYRIEKHENEKMADEMLPLRCYLMLQQVVRLNIIPIGICSMSEKQGGQHEIGSKPVQAACNFFTILTVDGQNRDLVNIWRAVEVDAGDFLILRLEFCKEEPNTKHVYVLNHYYKDTVTRTVSMHPHTQGRIQLVPDVFKFGSSKQKDTGSWCSKDHFTRKISISAPAWTPIEDKLHQYATDPRYSGYWHIGQTYNKKMSFTNVRVPINDMEMTKGQLLQINFAPVWKGTMHMHEHLTEENVDFCPAYAVQCLMFGTVPQDTRTEDMFVDATVTDRRPAGNTLQPPLFRAGLPRAQTASNSNIAATSASLIAPATTVNASTAASVPVASVSASSVSAASVSSASVSTASVCTPTVSTASVPAASVPAASVPAAPMPVPTFTPSVSDIATRSISAVLDEAVESATSSNAASKTKAATSKSDWDFETEIENMFAAEQSSGKPKRPKTKSSNTAL